MLTNHTAADLHTLHRRKRRLLVGLVLGVILVLLLGGVAALSLAPSAMSIEDARAVFERLEKESAFGGTTYTTKKTRDDLIALFGKPTNERTSKGTTTYSWRYIKQTFSAVEWFELSLRPQQGKDYNILFEFQDTLTGRDAWRFRWRLLKERLGVK